MLCATGDPVSPSALVRVDIDHRGHAVTYWIDQDAFAVASMWHFYGHAEDLLAALRDLQAQDSPVEGSLIRRVSRHARTVAMEPSMEAAIGFTDIDGENGLVRLRRRDA